MAVIALNSLVYTAILPVYQGILVVGMALGMAGLIFHKGSLNLAYLATLYGVLVFFLASVSDIAMYADLFFDNSGNYPIAEAAMVVFALAQVASAILTANAQILQARNAQARTALEKQALEKLNIAKTRMLANVTHELKTPLTVISGYAQYSDSVLRPMPGIEETHCREYLRLIDSEAQRMSVMVSQILDATRIEEGRMSLRMESRDINALVMETLQTYYPVFAKNENRLMFTPDVTLGPVSCDSGRILQVLLNLMTNASRHTRRGIIAIETGRRQGEILVTIRDNGEGMTPQRMAHLFERYHTDSLDGSEDKKEKAVASRETGTGLGLYVCRHIIEAHGGTIWLESEPGRGTTACFTLRPCDASPPAETNTVCLAYE